MAVIDMALVARVTSNRYGGGHSSPGGAIGGGTIAALIVILFICGLFYNYSHGK
jgi:hypothetical protein